MAQQKCTIVLTGGEKDDELSVNMKFDPPLEKGAQPTAVTMLATAFIDLVQDAVEMCGNIDIAVSKRAKGIELDA